ncbi:MAG: zinc carboxypeptidase [Saprospiraceae bacterium]|nr:zinc carboxypeptidase [Saprospiraceae bacterium]
MKRLLVTILVLFGFLFSGISQIPLTYYLPDISYDKAIPTPENVFGHQVGIWHLSHDKQYMYMRELAATSKRVKLVEYARTHEDRPSIYLIITSEKNHENLETLKAQHVQLSNPEASAKLEISKMPAVVYQGFSIHGNEASGGNAAPLVAYYLAAGKSKELEKLLENTIILFDPCFNPDGFQRFSTWVNQHKNKNLTADPQDREYREVWPGGRSNHYWFDLNRDWLPIVHPESKGRLRTFHEWKPNILTDHHEMGSNSSFFFQPGLPQRTNPITPWKNQELTAKIGNYHAAALDEIGSFYYTQEDYDDFYYGKGSTYPDVNGCIGILFEQASSRGHLQNTANGELSFPFTIRNQVTTALSTLKAAQELREELLNYQREFYRTGLNDASSDNVKGYVFGESVDKGRLNAFLSLLLSHQIKTHKLASTLEIGGKKFDPDHAFVVEMEQTQYRLIRGMFEKSTTFRDSLFYDISAWTLPLAYNLDYAPLRKNEFSKGLLGAAVLPETVIAKPTITEISNYAYAFEWDEYYAPKLLNAILIAGIRAKVTNKPFFSKNKNFDRGTILIPVQNQSKNANELHTLLENLVVGTGVQIYDLDTGLTSEGIDLGSGYFSTLATPNVLLVVGDGVSNTDAGEAWHQLDERYGIAITKIETSRLGSVNLSPYNVIVMVDGFYNAISQAGVESLKTWNINGGTIIGVERAITWLASRGLAKVEFKTKDTPKDGRRPYDRLEDDGGSEVIGGAIFETEIDLTHPIFYGFNHNRLPVFQSGTVFMKPTKNNYATPSVFTENPLMSGYIKASNAALIKNAASVVVSGNGSGKVICLGNNPNFRAFWYGTNKIFANAIFFGNIIESGGVERAD